MKRIATFFLTVLLFFPANALAENDLSSLPTSGYPQKIQNIINNYIDNGGFILPAAKETYRFNSNKLFTPASILKIATASAALSILGPEYRFATSFYQDTNGDFYIKGNGDPFLTSEEIEIIWSKLGTLKLLPIQHIYIDNSAFALESATPNGANGSDNPYDALNASVSVNFNTLPIKVKSNKISSHEKQTPFLPLMNKYAKNLKQGKHRIAISNNRNDIATYAGQLFIYLSPFELKHTDIDISQKKVPNELHPLYVHYSTKSLKDIIPPMLRYSNNFTANQIFLVCAAEKYGFPATWAKGRKALTDFLNKELKIDSSQFFIKEGSGLSRGNKFTPDAMLTVLEHFKPFFSLLPQKKNLYIKSGTLTGVYSYAGYVQKNGALLPLVIMLNQNKNTRDRILRLSSK